MDSDEEDYVFYGTPIEREEELTSRKKKSMAEASGHLRSLVPWKQEVRDEEGRRRFHGAFTGGYSAGYYNTVGSKEGWTPQSFTSSRKNRAKVKQQSILNFLDEDEKSDMEGRSFGTSMQFDTFGFTAAELARKQAEKEQQLRPSAIPGPVPDELILPATESIGVKLLLKMGWRHGHAIRESRTNSLYDARREARKAFLAFSSDDANEQPAVFESLKSDVKNVIEQPADDNFQSSQTTPVYVRVPKQDLYGLGYDPFKHAPEFREKNRSMSSNREHAHRRASSMKESLFGFKSGKVAPGFGIGALEELNAEDEDVYASGYDFEVSYVQEDEEHPRLTTGSNQNIVKKESGSLPGFRVASNSDYQLERFHPPTIPGDFAPHHKFPGPLETHNKHTDLAPPDVPPPQDNNLKLLIDGVATLVARCGKLFEDISREKNQSNPLFSFLTGGNGHDYYARRLWEERKKRNDQSKPHLDGNLSPSVQKMTAERRGRVLGERPLERSSRDSSSSIASADIHLQFHLSDTFTNPISFNDLPEVATTFKDDPAKQERFEQFLKEKYQGGLRSTDSGGASNMSEAARARERLDFEAVAEAIQKGKVEKERMVSRPQFMDILATGGMQFTSGGAEQVKDTQIEDIMAKAMYPKREEFQWRPSPVLCKRFDLIDPYMGQPPPAARIRGKIDSLIFTSDSGKAMKVEETVTAYRDVLPVHQSDKELGEEVSQVEAAVAVEAENVERPIDLYKAIFSDDSDDEGETAGVNQVEDSKKKIEVANTTLSRLIAGDFLESLGKELGLEVPPDLPYSTNKPGDPALQKEPPNVNIGNASLLRPENKPSPRIFLTGREQHHQQIAQERKYEEEEENIHGNPSRSGQSTDMDTFENKSGKLNLERTKREDLKAKRSSSHRQNQNSSSSAEDERSREDERSWKRSRRGRYRSSDSDSDSSIGHRDRYHSRSKGRKKGSSREKSSSSSKHSKHRKHGSRDHSSRYHYGSEKEHTEAKR